MDSFPALPGVYRILFLYLEPLSTITPALMVWIFPGATWFYQQLIPSALSVPTGVLEPRSLMAVWQLVNCYFLLGLISSLVFRAIRDALPNNPAAQERILGASFLALGIADLTHIAATFVGLPVDLRYAPSAWNSMTHGNISAVVVLFAFRRVPGGLELAVRAITSDSRIPMCARASKQADNTGYPAPTPQVMSRLHRGKARLWDTFSSH